MRRDSRATGCSTPRSSSTPTTARRRSSRRSPFSAAIAPIRPSSPRSVSPASSASNAAASSASSSSRMRAARPSAANEPATLPSSSSASSSSPRACRIRASATAASDAAGLELERAAQRRLVARLDEAVGLVGQQRVEELLDLRRRLGADELGGELAVLERLHGRDPLDPERGGDVRVGVGVELGQRDLALALGDELLEHRRQLAAGPAPGGPEVDDHRHLLGALDDVLLERRLCGVEDHTTRIPSVTELTIDSNGVTLAGDEEGEGVPVVLLHGLTATRRYVVMGSKNLARSGHRVIAYDARGHGRSGPAGDPDAYGYDVLAARPARRARRPRHRPGGAGRRVDGRPHAGPLRAGAPGACGRARRHHPGVRPGQPRARARPLGRALARPARGRGRRVHRGLRRATRAGAVPGHRQDRAAPAAVGARAPRRGGRRAAGRPAVGGVLLVGRSWVPSTCR